MECSHKREEINNYNLLVFSKESLWNASLKVKRSRKHHPLGMLPETQGKSTQVAKTNDNRGAC
jgi:hypothetical protein